MTIVLVSGLLGSLMLDRGHAWGDDFAQYILQARALASGQMVDYLRATTFVAQNSESTFPAPITVPWGLPLLLAPVWLLFGTKLLAFKLVLTIAYVLFLIGFFFLSRTRLSTAESLLLTAVLAFNPLLLRAQNDILTDIPFLLLSTIALCLIERGANTRPSIRGFPYGLALLGLIIFMAALTRQNGFLLFIPLAVTQYLHSGRGGTKTSSRLPSWQTAAPYLVFVACYALTTPMLPGANTSILPDIVPSGAAAAQPSSATSIRWDRLWANTWYYFWLPAEFTNYTMYQGLLVYLVQLVFIGLELRYNFRADLALLLYALAIVALYIIFGGRQGPRYIYPILPILLLFAYGGMKRLAGKMPPAQRKAGMMLVWVFWIGLAASSLAADVTHAAANLRAGRESPTGAYAVASLEMFSFIRKATPPGSILIFHKPNAMRLLTNRDTFVTTECRALPTADYVILVKSGTPHQISPSRIGTCNPSVILTRVYGKDDFEVFQIDPRQ